MYILYEKFERERERDVCVWIYKYRIYYVIIENICRCILEKIVGLNILVYVCMKFN